MKIAFVINNYPPKTGGVEQHVAALAKHLVACGHEILICTLADHTSTSNEDGIRVYRFKEYLQVDGILGFPGASSVKEIYALLKSEKVDVISTHTRFFSMSWLGVVLGKLLRVPVVHTEHGSGYVVSDKKFISVASRIVDTTLGCATLKASSKVLCVSDPSKDFVKTLSGVNAEVFYNVSPLPAKSAHEVNADPKKLIFLARVVEVKGWRAFLDVVDILSKEDDAVHAVVLGAGADLEKAKAYAQRKGIADRVNFRGFVSHADVAEELAGATLVNPTVAAEGFQTTIIDALVSQAGIVTYDVSSARVLEERGIPVRIVEKGDSGALLEATRAAINSPAVAYDENQLLEWGWKKQTEVYEAILQKQLNK